MSEPTASPVLDESVADVAAATSSAPRVFTLRALIIGVVVAGLLAVLTPWNDWFVHNTYFYSNYMPPIVTALLVLVGAVVNPLLGRWRLRAGEVALITVMALGVGGVASSGLMRLWPGAVAGMPRYVSRTSPAHIKVHLSEAEVAQARATATTALAAELKRRDGDGDGRLTAAEAGLGEGFAAADSDRDGRLDGDEYARYRLASEPALVPDWRWAMPSDLFLGFPATGDIPQNDAEYKYVVDGYLDGLPKPSEPRIGHRARVTWVDPAGTRHERELALSGAVLAATADRRGVLDLDDSTGQVLAGLKAGQIATLVGGGEARVIAIEPPSVPWSAWIVPLLGWAPLLLGSIVASVAIAFLVRRQWMEHERLPYPAAAAALTLLEDPLPGRRFASIYRDRGFWAGLAVAVAIIGWRGLFRLHVISVDFVLDIDLLFGPGQPCNFSSVWSLMDPCPLLHPTVFLSISALAFFLPMDLSFSLWFFYVLANVVVWFLRERLGLGAVVTFTTCRSVGTGSFLAMAPLIIWLGRTYYWRVLKAAVGARGDAAARAAAPFAWAALIGAAAIAGFFVAHGVPVLDGVLMAVVFLGFLLVISRVLAEAGVPFLQVPLGVDSLLFSLLGYGLPVGALVALSSVSFTLLPDGRESLMPYAANAAFLGARTGLPSRRLGGTMMLVAAVAVVLSAGSMLWNAYRGNGHEDGWLPYQSSIQTINDRVGDLDNPAALAQSWESRRQIFASYGLGAALVAVCGVGRMLFSVWPLHPLAWCVAFTYPGGVSWFSFFVAWLAKSLVMRYGGVGLYKRLKPVAIGLIAGEAIAMAVFILVKLSAKLMGVALDSYNALPG